MTRNHRLGKVDAHLRIVGISFLTLCGLTDDKPNGLFNQPPFIAGPNSIAISQSQHAAYRTLPCFGKFITRNGHLNILFLFEVQLNELQVFSTHFCSMVTVRLIDATTASHVHRKEIIASGA